MKKFLLSLLLITPFCLNAIRGVETTTQRAIKKHKAQQQKNEKKTTKNAEKTLSQH